MEVSPVSEKIGGEVNAYKNIKKQESCDFQDQAVKILKTSESGE